MATFIRLATDAAQRLLARSREVTQANRDADAERRRRAALTTNATTAATQATPVARVGGLLDHPSRYTTRPKSLPPGQLSLGWIEGTINAFSIPSTTARTARIISGNGNAYTTVSTPAYPNPTQPPSVEITWDTPFGDWFYFGTFAPLGGTFWARIGTAAVLDATLPYTWGNNHIVNGLVMPHGNGFILTIRNKADQRFGWYTYRIIDTTVTNFVRGGPSDDPDVLMETPSNRHLYFEADNSSPVVISGPNEYQFLNDTIHSFNVTGNSVRQVATPGGMRERFVAIYGDIGSVDYVPDFVYYTGSDPVQTFYRGLGAVTVDGTLYPRVTVRQIRGDGIQPGVNNWWPTVEVPNYTPLYQGQDTDLALYADASTTGLAFIDTSEDNTNSQRLLPSEAGTPFIYRALLNTVTRPVPEPYNALLFDVIDSLAPLPPRFSIIQALTTGAPNYVGTDTTLTFPSYRAVPENFPPAAPWDGGFAAAGVPSARSAPGTYRTSLVPLEQRQPAGEAGVSSLFATTFGDDSYCRTSLLALGFTPADLTP